MMMRMRRMRRMRWTDDDMEYTEDAIDNMIFRIFKRLI
jgi:hypothetical protein